MNELKIFENPKFGKIRTIEENGDVLFCAKDVAAAFGYKDTTNAIKQHCKGVVKRHLPTNGGMQETNFIPEGDIYRLAARSELDGAAELESWIFDIVIPSIRKHGAYMTPATIENMITNPEFGIKLLTALKDEQEKRIALEAENGEQKKLIETQRPLVEFAQHVGEASNAISVGNFAKLLNDENIEVGQNRLFAWLRNNGYIQADNVPYQRYIDAGYFKVIEQTYETPYGRKTNTKTLITGKGQIYFTEKLRMGIYA